MLNSDLFSDFKFGFEFGFQMLTSDLNSDFTFVRSIAQALVMDPCSGVLSGAMGLTVCKTMSALYCIACCRLALYRL
jgi:hypothetical protein